MDGVVAREPLHTRAARALPSRAPCAAPPTEARVFRGPLGLPRQPSDLAASCRRACCGPSRVERYFPPWAPRLCSGCVRGCVRGVAWSECGASRGPRQRGAVLGNLGGRTGERTTACLQANTAFGLCPPPAWLAACLAPTRRFYCPGRTRGGWRGGWRWTSSPGLMRELRRRPMRRRAR